MCRKKRLVALRGTLRCAQRSSGRCGHFHLLKQKTRSSNKQPAMSSSLLHLLASASLKQPEGQQQPSTPPQHHAPRRNQHPPRRSKARMRRVTGQHQPLTASQDIHQLGKTTIDDRHRSTVSAHRLRRRHPNNPSDPHHLTYHTVRRPRGSPRISTRNDTAMAMARFLLLRASSTIATTTHNSTSAGAQLTSVHQGQHRWCRRGCWNQWVTAS